MAIQLISTFDINFRARFNIPWSCACVYGWTALAYLCQQCKLLGVEHHSSQVHRSETYLIRREYRSTHSQLYYLYLHSRITTATKCYVNHHQCHSGLQGSLSVSTSWCYKSVRKNCPDHKKRWYPKYIIMIVV